MVKTIAARYTFGNISRGYARHRENKFLFAIFCIWSLVLLSRIHELFAFLIPLRPVLVIGVVLLLGFFFNISNYPWGLFYRNTQVKQYLLLVAIMTISIPFAIYRRGAFDYFVIYLNFIIFFIMFFHIVNSVEKLKLFILLSCLGSGIYFLISLTQGQVSSKRLAFGTTFDPNDLAFYALSFLPLNLIFISRNNKPVFRILAFVAFLIETLTILASGSRGGIIGFSLVIVMLLLTRTSVLRFSHKFLFVVGILLILSLNIIDINFDRYQTILSPADDYNVTAETGRKQIWIKGVGIMLAHPLTGVGISCFSEAIGSDREHGGKVPVWQAAHNSLIQIGAETGLIGLFLFGALTYRAFKIFGRVGKQRRNPDITKICEMAKLGFLGHFISGMFLSEGYSGYWVLYIALSAVVSNIAKQELKSN